MNCLCTVVANDTAVWAPSFTASILIHWSIPLLFVALVGEAITEKLAALFEGQLSSSSVKGLEAVTKKCDARDNLGKPAKGSQHFGIVHVLVYLSHSGWKKVVGFSGSRNSSRAPVVTDEAFAPEKFDTATRLSLEGSISLIDMKRRGKRR